MKNVELGGFVAMRCEDKDKIQIVSVGGEVDLASAPRLHALIWQAKERADDDPPRVIVDLSELEFMDTAGLGVLLEESNAIRQSGGRLCLVAREGPVTRLLEITGLSESFDLYAELDRAVGSCTLAPA
jgi:anti-sigma B factor antagonist